jgi:hypothetical protein
MKINNAWLKSTLIIFLVTTFFSGCIPSVLFTSDREMLVNFNTNKVSIVAIMNKCKLQGEVKTLRIRSKEFFSACELNLSDMKKINLKEVDKPSENPIPYSRTFSGFPILLVINHIKLEDYSGTLIKEKGYVFSEDLIKDELIEKRLLDEVTSTRLTKENKINEQWRFKKIEPNWYLYYREYFAPGFVL